MDSGGWISNVNTEYLLFILAFSFSLHSTSLLYPSRVSVAIQHIQWDTRSIRLPWTRDRSLAEIPDNTQYSHETDNHATGEIRTRNPRKRTAADPCLRVRQHWSQKLHNTPVRTDSRQGSRNQKHYCLCEQLHWNRYDWNVISPDCLEPTMFVSSQQSGQIPAAVRTGFWVSLQCSWTRMSENRVSS